MQERQISVPKGTFVLCPNCGEIQLDENKVEDWCIHGEIGAASTCPDKCHNCDYLISVNRNGDGTYTVSGYQGISVIL